MLIDLHCHSTASDGALTPQALWAMARERGIALLALTDHDSMAGYLALRDIEDSGLQLVAGVELSCQWQGVNIHVVGLGLDADHPTLIQGLVQQGESREQRARTIGERLAKAGMAGAYEGARRIAGEAVIGRPHFAQFLCEQGHVRQPTEAFDNYLGAGKLGDVKVHWPELSTVIDWINAAGGLAVLAHPIHYRLTNAKLGRLLTEFVTAGGRGMEVVSGTQTQDQTRYMARLSREFGLLASMGSDFHGPETLWRGLGVRALLPEGCTPIWEALQA